MKFNSENKGNENEKIEVAHMTSGGRGLYIGGAEEKRKEQEFREIEAEKILEKQISEFRGKDIEEELQSAAGISRVPKSFSSKSRGGTFGTPKFKEKLKLKNFRAKISEILKSKKIEDKESAEALISKSKQSLAEKYSQEAEEFEEHAEKEAKETEEFYGKFEEKR